VNRGHITSCSYATKIDSESRPQDGPDQPQDASQSRIDRLENLVLALLKNQQAQSRCDQAATPSSSVGIDNEASYEFATDDQGSEGLPDQLAASKQSPAQLPTTRTGISIGAEYKQVASANEAHWALLLNEISAVRSYLSARDRQYDEQLKRLSQTPRGPSLDPGPTLLFGSARSVSRSEILSQLPSRYSCDTIVARFFFHLYPASEWHSLRMPFEAVVDAFFFPSTTQKMG
jgi:hypothetical protein